MKIKRLVTKWSGIWPNDIFNPIEIRVDASIHSRDAERATALAKRSHSIDCIHARNTRMVSLNWATTIPLQKSYTFLFAKKIFKICSIWKQIMLPCLASISAFNMWPSAQLSFINNAVIKHTTDNIRVAGITLFLREYFQHDLLQVLAWIWNVIQTTPTRCDDVTWIDWFAVWQTGWPNVIAKRNASI